MPLHGTPLADVSLHGTQHPVGKLAGVIFLEFAQQRDAHQSGRATQQWHHVAIPDLGKRVDS